MFNYFNLHCKRYGIAQSARLCCTLYMFCIGLMMVVFRPKHVALMQLVFHQCVDIHTVCCVLGGKIHIFKYFVEVIQNQNLCQTDLLSFRSHCTEEQSAADPASRRNCLFSPCIDDTYNYADLIKFVMHLQPLIPRMQGTAEAQWLRCCGTNR